MPAKKPMGFFRRIFTRKPTRTDVIKFKMLQQEAANKVITPQDLKELRRLEMLFSGK